MDDLIDFFLNSLSEYPLLTIGISIISLFIIISAISGIFWLIGYIKEFREYYKKFKLGRDKFISDYDKLFDEDHYLAFSEMEDFKSEYNDLVEVLKHLLTKYRKFFVDESRLAKYDKIIVTLGNFEEYRKIIMKHL